ncbi:MAG: reverse transcriptase domain-containing protein [Pseudonocardiaceae bacterium]
MEYLTVEEVADRLNLSVATVRRRCASSEIDAIKAGPQWLVDPEALDNPKVKRKRKSVRHETEYNFRVAFTHVQSTDLSEAWVPDVLRFRDQTDNRDFVIAEAQRRISDHEFLPPHRLDVPKTPFSNRPGVLLDLPDRVAYQAVVATFADKIEAALTEAVYSSRLSDDPKYFLQHGPRRWVKFEKDAEGRAKGNFEWVAQTDISSYFEHILHQRLFDELSHLGVGGSPLRTLREMLSKWSLVQGMGLPQGPNASRVLGNFYLVQVDEIILDAGYTYYRYMDDVRILTQSKAEAVAGIRLFEHACRGRGLTPSSAKTKVLPVEDYVRLRADPDTDRASYLFDHGSLPKVRIELKKVLKKALDDSGVNHRKARFSIWRLARIRESTVLGQILENLEMLAPVSSAVAAYLKHFVSRSSAHSRIAAFLSDPTRSYSSFLRSWVYAAMLECKKVPEQWRRLAEQDARNRNNQNYLRAVAVCVLARARIPRDLNWIRSELEMEHDPVMKRGYIVALAYGGGLDRTTTNAATRSDAVLAVTANWLKSRTRLPSLLYADQSINIR